MTTLIIIGTCIALLLVGSEIEETLSPTYLSESPIVDKLLRLLKGGLMLFWAIVLLIRLHIALSQF